MEVLVIVDETMTQVHGSNLTGYIHTLMNIVDETFHHETLGISINIVLRDEHFSSRDTLVTQKLTTGGVGSKVTQNLKLPLISLKLSFSG